ncbi:MAG: DUF1538 domain-containing protein [Clostridia bacterium]|nr:DUF1538 domain-containing protein [Clostridia bacterium]
MVLRRELIKKIKEALISVLPVALIVAFLCFTVAPMSTDLMLCFVIGTVMIIVGLGLFTFGSESSMTQIGNHIGAKLTKSKRLPLIIIISFLLGVIITIAEPDLQVLAQNVPHINTGVLIITVSVGVGIFLVLCMLRILFAIPLKWVLLISYSIVFILAAFSDPDYLSVAFDSGGVTTGPMTVPFIMALGVGVASIRSDKNAEADSFGLVALCSVGPILAVLILGFVYKSELSEIAASIIPSYSHTVQLGTAFLHAIPEYMLEVLLALAPIMIFFLIFQIFSLKLRKLPFGRIMLGLIFTYAGLVLFLSGVNVGFSALGTVLGSSLASGGTSYVLIPFAAAIGWFIVTAEPAVHVLTSQVEEISAGAVSKRAMQIALSIAIAAAMGLAMLRVQTGISILWFVVPGYVIALGLTFFVPPMFTAIAFDSGGVTSGPMTATFMLPFAMGACQAYGGNILTDAFGLVALVAMMPLITIQIMGVVFRIRSRKTEETVPSYGDSDIIELWEV